MKYIAEHWVELGIFFAVGMCAGVMYMPHSPISNKVKELQVSESLDQAHEGALAKMVQQEQFQIDTITEYINESKIK